MMTNEETLMNKKISNDGCMRELSSRDVPFCFGTFGFASDLTSPIDSVESTENDEEDYIMELTRQMSNSNFPGVYKKHCPGFPSEKMKVGSMTVSPTSALCDLEILCGSKKVSSRGSPTGPFPENTKPPATWDLLYAAAGEVARMRRDEQVSYCNYSNRGLLDGLARKPSPNSYQSISRLQFQYQQLKHLQMLKQQSQFAFDEQINASDLSLKHQQYQYQRQLTLQNQARYADELRKRVMPHMRPSGPAPPQQPLLRNVGDTRAVIFEQTATKRSCTGTGVFIPSRAGFPSDSERKPAALSSRQIQPRFNDGCVRIGNHNLFLAAPQNHNIHHRANLVMNQDVVLPPEWTY